ncbi:type VI secretion system Vgr family protein [Leclercia adecarboxylata]|uniref:type VI secretion system Vgr family protein n=1 Tax=Leclercia adecarboxylata TaxID=83655 RepID=UPI00254B7B53|nr:type VI secretion system tip protein VgrG [Leclercia adecarboxylata]
MDNWLALFDGQTRHTLRITGSAVTPDVLRFSGREALSEPFRWEIDFTTPQDNIAPQDVLMKHATLHMRSGKAVHGIITRLEWISTTADQSHYQVVLSSRLALLTRIRQCSVFQNQSVPEVVEQVLRQHGLEGADFDFRLERTYPARELITQWRETDLEFIQRILSEVGIFWRTEMDEARGLDIYIFADSQLNYRFDVHLPYREPSGLYDGAQESVWDVSTLNQVVPGMVSVRDYNYRIAGTPMDATVSVRSEAVTTGEHYRYVAPYREAGDDTDPEPETESGAFYARIHHERELNASARIHLESNAACLLPGQVLEPQGEVIRALKEGVVITTMEYSSGDIDLPYISHALHDSEHPDHVARDNHTRNVLRTPANNKLRMEDRRGEEHIKLATEYGKTQLNTGHLVDVQEIPRGKGFELRTDEHGVIRVAKGLFITADGQQKAAGEVLEMETALKEIDICLQQLQQLETAAEQAQALKADIDSQIQMFEKRLKPLNETLLFSAPEGMAFTSGEHLQMTAAKNIAINAGSDISTGVMGNMTALAGEKIGLFARTGQLSLKASEGQVEMQAQNGKMQLIAEKKLTMSSASNISFAGKKRITLIGGGSYLRLEAGKIEYGTVGTYLRRTKRTMAAAPATMPLPIPLLPGQYPPLNGSICIECLLNAIRANDAIVQGA